MVLAPSSSHHPAIPPSHHGALWMFLWGEEGGREGKAGWPLLECYSFCSPKQLPERLACGSWLI